MVHKSLSLTLGQSFEHITLYTYNGAAIFFRSHPYIWSTTVLHNTVEYVLSTHGQGLLMHYKIGGGTKCLLSAYKV